MAYWSSGGIGVWFTGVAARAALDEARYRNGPDENRSADKLPHPS